MTPHLLPLLVALLPPLAVAGGGGALLINNVGTLLPLVCVCVGGRVGGREQQLGSRSGQPGGWRGARHPGGHRSLGLQQVRVSIYSQSP